MKCNWLGREIAECGSSAAKHALVVMTPITFDADMRTKLSEITGITLLDIKLRFHANGFFIVSKSADAHSLGEQAKKLIKAGFKPYIFDESSFFDVPDIEKPSSFRVDGGAITFISNLKSSEVSFGSSARLLVVKGHVEIDTKKISTKATPYFSPYAVATVPMTIHKSQSSKKQIMHIVNIYDMDGKNAVQLREGRFNFHDAFKESAAPNFSANCDLLLRELDKMSMQITVDELFNSSSLPLAGRDKNVSRDGVRFFSNSNLSITSSEINEFDQYSRFRCIVEQRLAAERV
ncbi:MAG: hypothetical protein WCX65_12625 [bacterium]